MQIDIDGRVVTIGSLGRDSGPDYVSGIEGLFRESGKPFLNTEKIERYIPCGVIVVALHQGDVVGALLSALWGATETEQWQSIVPNLRTDPPAFAAEQMGVRPSWRNQGIGTRLLQHAMADVFMTHNRQPFPRWMAISRVPKQGPSSYSLLKRLGFAELARAANFYADDDGGCPSCGDGPCTCSAVLMEFVRKE